MNTSDTEQKIEKTTRSRFKRVLRSLLINSFLLILIATVADWFHGRSMLETAEKAPTFTLTTLLSDSPIAIPAKDKPTLVYFSAPWCGVCGVTGDNIERVKSWLGADVLVEEVSLAYSSKQELLQYSKGHNDRDFLVGNDQVMNNYQVSSFPSFYFITADGTVKFSTAGYTSTLGLYLRALYYL